MTSHRATKVQQPPTKLLLELKPSLIAFAVKASLAAAVGIGLLAVGKQVTVECVRHQDGTGQCRLVETSLLGTSRQELALSDISDVEISRGNVTLATSRGTSLNLGFPGESGYDLRRFMRSADTETLRTNSDLRVLGIVGLAILIGLGAFVYQHSLKMTVSLDRDRDRLRVAHRGLMGRREREVRLSDVTQIEVIAHDSTVLAARLKGGEALSFVPSFVEPAGKQRLAEQCAEFLAVPVVDRAADAAAQAQKAPRAPRARK
jgi:hypothetical protein